MSATIAKRLVELLIGLIIIAVIIGFFRDMMHLLSGKAGTVTWPVNRDIPDIQKWGSPETVIEWTHGTIKAPYLHGAWGIDLVAGIATSVLLVLSLLALRRVLLSFHAHEFVTVENAEAMKRIGKLLLAIAAISVLHVIIVQNAIISSVYMPEGYALHPSISWNKDGVTNIWLDYDVPVTTFFLGLLSLLFGKAIESGVAFREDSEEVV